MMYSNWKAITEINVFFSLKYVVETPIRSPNSFLVTLGRFGLEDSIA